MKSTPGLQGVNWVFNAPRGEVITRTFFS
jgi:hypothetical protein